MKGIIEELWRGDIIPQENCRINSMEMKEASRLHIAAPRRFGEEYDR